LIKIFPASAGIFIDFFGILRYNNCVPKGVFMEKYKDLIVDLQEYQQYLPILQEYFTLDVKLMKIRDELIELLSCKTDEQVAQNMIHTRHVLRRDGYTWQFNKSALKKFFDAVIADAQNQQKWTKKEWMAVALKAAQMLAQQQDKLQQERRNVAMAVSVAGYAAERGADKARPTATDTKSRLRDFGEATRKLDRQQKAITTADIEKLNNILTGRRISDYTA